jgi:hypothetical protein
VTALEFESCVPADVIRPALTDALDSINTAMSRERSRTMTVALLRVRSDLLELVRLLPPAPADVRTQ